MFGEKRREEKRKREDDDGQEGEFVAYKPQGRCFDGWRFSVVVAVVSGVFDGDGDQGAHERFSREEG